MTGTTEVQEPEISGPNRSNNRKPVFYLVSALGIVALVAAVWFGFGWGKVLFGEKPTADTRDAALTGAQQVAINLNTVDAANIDQSFEDMKSSITGDTMLNDLEQTQSGITDQVRQSGAKSSAELLHSTLTELSEDDGSATALVVVATTTTWPDRSERSKVTMRLSMVDEDGVWKANKVDPVGSRISLDNPSASPAIPDPGTAATDRAAPTDPAAAPTAPAPAQAPTGSGQ